MTNGTSYINSISATYTTLFLTHSLLLVLLMRIQDLLYFALGAHEDTRPVMNMLRHNLQHALHLAVNRRPTS